MRNIIWWIEARITKKLQDVFKSNLKEIWRGRHKSKEQESALETIKLLYDSGEVVTKLFNDYLLILFEENQLIYKGSKY